MASRHRRGRDYRFRGNRRPRPFGLVRQFPKIHLWILGATIVCRVGCLVIKNLDAEMSIASIRR